MTTTTDRATYGTEISSTHVAKRRDGDWDHHVWDVTLTRNGETITFPYRMGTGHEQSKCGKRKPGIRAGSRPYCHSRCEHAGWVPTPPDLYDVLTGLKADDPQGETFADWCANFGYDTDSRKAMESYLACQESADRSARFFGSDWALLQADEDYA